MKINNYDVKLKIFPEKGEVAVKSKVQVEMENEDTLRFYLHKELKIHRVETEHIEEYYFLKREESPFFFMPDAKPLEIRLEKKLSGKRTVEVTYSGRIKDLKWKVNTITDEWIELGIYSAWYPSNPEAGDFTYKVEIDLPDSYTVIGLGEIHKSGRKWRLVRTEPINDIIVVASEKLRRYSSSSKRSIEVFYYADVNQNIPKEIVKNGDWALKKFENWFGRLAGEEKITFVLVPKFRAEWGGYARKNFVVLCPSKRLDKDFLRYISHEIAHLWWLNAPVNSWEDWLNESFAEYSALMAIREKYGEKVYNEFLKKKMKDLDKLPPIFGLNRQSEKAYRVLYDKGPVILSELENKIGREKFLMILRKICLKKVKSTQQLLSMLSRLHLENVRVWFENKLKT